MPEKSWRVELSWPSLKSLEKLPKDVSGRILDNLEVLGRLEIPLRHKDVLRYKDFIGSVHFSAEDECFFGKIEGVDDLVTFEGRDVDELKRSFREAVVDYINLCRTAGKPSYKSYIGTFNVRMTTELHQKAARKSALLGISLNQLARGRSKKSPRALTAQSQAQDRHGFFVLLCKLIRAQYPGRRPSLLFMKKYLGCPRRGLDKPAAFSYN